MEGNVRFRGDRFRFVWKRGPMPFRQSAGREASAAAVLDVWYGADCTHELKMAMLDELIRIFPDREPPRVIQPAQPPFLDRFAEKLAVPFGCLFLVVVIGSTLFLAGYGVFALLAQP